MRFFKFLTSFKSFLEFYIIFFCKFQKTVLTIWRQRPTAGIGLLRIRSLLVQTAAGGGMQALSHILLVLGSMLLMLLLMLLLHGGDAAVAAVAQQQCGRAAASVAPQFCGHGHIDCGLLLPVQSGGLLERHHRHGRWRLAAT